MLQSDKPQPIIVIYPNGDVQSALTLPDLIHAMEDMVFNLRFRMTQQPANGIVAAPGPLRN
jgi:hypothetical protein